MEHAPGEKDKQLASSSGQKVLASCGPLTLIVADVLAEQLDSRKAMQQICTFLSTDDAFIPAIRNCELQLPVKFGPPVSFKAATSFAGEICTAACSIVCSFAQSVSSGYIDTLGYGPQTEQCEISGGSCNNSSC
jgi:hypothetical protein